MTMIKNYNYPMGNGERELYIGGLCPELGGEYTRAYIACLGDFGWMLTVQGVKTVFVKAPVSSDTEYLRQVEVVKEFKLLRETYHDAKVALGKINVTSCFCVETDGFQTRW